MARNSSYGLFIDDIIAPKSITVTMDRPYWKGPKPLAGREQIVTSSAGGWKFKYNDMPIYGSLGRRFQAYMSSYLYQPLVYLSPIQGPNMLVNHKTTTGISYALNSAVTAGAKQINVKRTGTSDTAYLAGEYLEINGRLHYCWNSAASGITGVDTLDIWPPLRGGYAANTAIEFKDPRCLVSVVTDENALSITQNLGAIGFTSVEFIEASWPNSASYP